MINLYFKNFNFNYSNGIGIAISDRQLSQIINRLKSEHIDFNLFSFKKLKEGLALERSLTGFLDFSLDKIEILFEKKFILLYEIDLETIIDGILLNAIADFILKNDTPFCLIIKKSNLLFDFYKDIKCSNDKTRLIVEIFKLRMTLLTKLKILYSPDFEFTEPIQTTVKEFSLIGFKLEKIFTSNPYFTFRHYKLDIKINLNIVKEVDGDIEKEVFDHKENTIFFNISFRYLFFHLDELINKCKIFPLILNIIENSKPKEIKFFNLSNKENLSAIQIEAVNEIAYPSLVLAGAGSGKTRVIVQKFLHLLNFMPPDNILVLTFTNNAVNEIKNRIESFLKKRGNDETKSSINPKRFLNIATYHSFFYSIVKEFYKELGYVNIPRIINENFEDSKNDGIFISYDDIVFEVNRLLKSEQILYTVSKRFKYILVDEYQDLDFLSDIIIKKIDFGRGKIMYAGDDDQSIYGFNGGEALNLLFFDIFYPSGRLFVFQKNYRSDPKIIEFGNCILKNISLRYGKNIFSVNNANIVDHDIRDNAAEPIQVFKFMNRKEELDFIVKIIQRFAAQGKKISILVRTNKEEENMKMFLHENSPFFDKDSTRLFIGTIHKSKGMEFDITIIPNTVNGNIPHYKNLSATKEISKNDLHPFLDLLKKEFKKALHDEELKLFYVAISRAKKAVFITYSGEKSIFLP